MNSIVNTKMEVLIEPDKNYVKNFVFKYEQYVDTKWVNLEYITDQIYTSLPEQITLDNFYNFAADHCVSQTKKHYDYNRLEASHFNPDLFH